MIKLIQLKKSENNIKIFEAEINRVGREMEAIKSGTKKRLNSEKSVQNLLARTGSEVEKTRVQFAWLLEWADGNLEKYARELIGKRDKQIFELNAQLNGMENRRIIETYNRIRMEGELEVLNRIDNSFADRPKDVAEIYRLKRKEKIQEQKRKVQ